MPHRLGRPVPVDPLQAALEVEVVAAQDLRHAGGGARAAYVLEEKGVEERGAVGGVEAELAGEAHADHAGSGGVPHRLALGQIDGTRERRDDLGLADERALGVGHDSTVIGERRRPLKVRTARVCSGTGGRVSRERDSNPRPSDYKSEALPAELSRRSFEPTPAAARRPPRPRVAWRQNGRTLEVAGRRGGGGMRRPAT